MTALAPTASADNPLGAATGGGIADPAGDVEIAADQVLAQAEIDSIDVTRLRWKVVKGRYASFRLHVVAAGSPGPHRAFFGVSASAGRASVLIAARKKKVVVVDDTGRHRCRGGTARLDEERDFVRLQLPVRCLPGTRYSFAPITLLEDPRGGRDVASDQVKRTPRVTIR